MTRPRVTTSDLTESQHRLIAAAIHALEVAYDCEMLAIIAQDKEGIYVSLRAGFEKDIAAHLYDCDWSGLFAGAMEYQQR